MSRERRISGSMRVKIDNFSKNSKINILNNTIEGVYYREVSLTHLKDKEIMHQSRETMRQDRTIMCQDRENMHQNLIEGHKDLINKDLIDKIEIILETKTIETTTTTIEITIENLI